MQILYKKSRGRHAERPRDLSETTTANSNFHRGGFEKSSEESSKIAGYAMFYSSVSSISRFCGKMISDNISLLFRVL